MAKATPFRFGPDTLADLDALASSAGSRAAANRDCIHYWHQMVAEAARKNAETLKAEEWAMLAHTGDPSTFAAGYTDSDVGRYPDWAHLLALELRGMWEGRPVLLPSQKDERAMANRLAGKIAGWGVVRGYALMAAVRWFWAHQDTSKAWWWPEVWMVAEVRDDTR